MSERLDILRDSSLYTIQEASKYLGIHRNTLKYWAVGEKRGAERTKPLIKIPKDSRLLSFFNLVELHVIGSLTRDHKVNLSNVRKAIKYIEDRLNIRRPLLNQSFETNGIDIFVEKYGELINASRGGQLAMKDILKNSLERIERDSKKIPIKLFPYTHTNPANSPKFICLNPSVFSGRPTIDGTGISTAVVASRFNAGETVADLSQDYNLSELQVQEAIRCELKEAA